MQLKMRYYRRTNGYFYYELQRGRPRSMKTRDPAHAKELWQWIKKEFLAGKLKALDQGKRATLGEFEKIFFKRHADIGDKTVEAYELAFKLLKQSLGDGHLIGRIDDRALAKFKGDCHARGVQKVSINTYLRHLRAILNKAHGWGYLLEKPRVKMYRLGKRLPTVFTQQQVKLLLEQARDDNPELCRVIQFALYTGARRQEIYNLTWDQVAGDTAKIIGKGDRQRIIPLAQEALAAMGPARDIGRVFYRPPGGLDQYSKQFKALCRSIDIENRHFHHLRHTAATQMLKSGIAINEVKEIMGHEDIKTTLLYAHLLEDHLRKSIQRLSYG